MDMDDHPSIYPDELVYRLIKMFSYEGDTVLDPFLGSGTTVKVARELNRDGIGYEKELQYKPVIMEKLGSLPDQAVDEGSETMAEFFKRVMDSEPSEPFVETIPVNTGKAVQNIEPAEEFSEASMPV
jgi:DNA modification methylase